MNFETGLNFTPPQDVTQTLVSRVMTRARSAQNRRVTCHDTGAKRPKSSCHVSWLGREAPENVVSRVVIRVRSARVRRVICKRLWREAPMTSLSCVKEGDAKWNTMSAKKYTTNPHIKKYTVQLFSIPQKT